MGPRRKASSPQRQPLFPPQCRRLRSRPTDSKADTTLPTQSGRNLQGRRGSSMLIQLTLLTMTATLATPNFPLLLPSHSPLRPLLPSPPYPIHLPSRAQLELSTYVTPTS